MISPEKVESLQRSWVQLIEPFGVSLNLAYECFDDLVAKYSESHRHYHTLEHLAEMFRVASRLRRYTTHFTEVQLAIWFHDAIYNPLKNDNEACSAAYAQEQLRKLMVPSEAVSLVALLIQSTQHGRAECYPAESDPTRGAYDVVHDADLAILGAAPARYDRYAAAIRAEYAHIAHVPFTRGRTAMLEAFLAQTTIYRTPLMQDEGETAARQNLQRELTQLQQAKFV